MAQKTREQILELVLPILKKSPSPNHEIAITGGSLATLLDLDWADYFEGGKSAAQLEAERLSAENEELRAKLAAAVNATAVSADSKPVAETVVVIEPGNDSLAEPPVEGPPVEETKPEPAEKPLPGETATVEPPVGEPSAVGIDAIG